MRIKAWKQQLVIAVLCICVLAYTLYHIGSLFREDLTTFAAGVITEMSHVTTKIDVKTPESAPAKIVAASGEENGITPPTSIMQAPIRTQNTMRKQLISEASASVLVAPLIFLPQNPLVKPAARANPKNK